MNTTAPPSPPPPSARRLLPNWFVGLLVLGLIVTAGLTTYLAYIVIRDVVFDAKIDPAGISILEGGERTLTLEELGEIFDINGPLQDPDGPAPKAWDGIGRVNILLIGVDYRTWETNQGPPLADTLIFTSYDPQTRDIVMLSIPRDLWVNLPYNLGYNKINQTYQLGEATHAPGGGAGVAMLTVEQLLGVPIHYYALIDFEAFTRLIDEIGGVKIDVPTEIVIDPLGDNNVKTLSPGVQTLPGDLALAYARNRGTAGSDFDRAARQQQIILGVRDRVVQYQFLPTLISKSPVLYQELSNGISTNMNIQQMFDLAWELQQIPPENIRTFIIGPDQVIFTTSVSGMFILQPIPDAIYELRDQIFNIAPPESPTSVAGMTLRERMDAEDASISIQNGTLTIGLAARTDQYLREKDIIAAEITNASELHAHTTIIDYSGKPNTVEYLVELFSIVPATTYHEFDPNSPHDIVIILGDDWAANNNMP